MSRNTTRRWLFVAGGLAVMSAVAVPAALAGGGWPGPCHGPPPFDVTADHISEAGGWFAEHLVDTVDRAAVEAVRLQGMALADEASSTAMDMVVEIANVLTLEQREAATEEIQRRHGR